MQNDYSRACKDISNAILSTSPIAGAVPAVEQALRTAAIQIEVMGLEENRRLFWEIVAGRGKMSQIHAMVHNNVQSEYGTPQFRKNEDIKIPKSPLLAMSAWGTYLRLNKAYIAGELPDYARPYHLFSYGSGTTRFYSPFTTINSSGHAKTEFDIVYPDLTIDRVYYTNALEGVERTDLNVLLNVNPVGYVDFERVNEDLVWFIERERGGIFGAFERDRCETPEWAELTAVGQYCARDEVVVSIENFTVHPSSKKPLPFKLSFYVNEEGRLSYTTNDVAYSFLTVKQGFWSNLPFPIRHLINQLTILEQGTYSTDYEVRDNDLFSVSPSFVPKLAE